MESSTLSLAAATLMVLMLVHSCKNTKPQKKTPCPKQPTLVVVNNRSDYSAQESKHGSGLKNRQLAEQYNELMNLKGYDDYNAVMKYGALEPEVFDSHESYSHDIGISNSGASTLAVRSDPNDVVNWVGLRRPDYHSAYADSTARIDHSESPDQMMAQTHYML